jgi:hypothetical protein
MISKWSLRLAARSRKRQYFCAAATASTMCGGSAGSCDSKRNADAPPRLTAITVSWRKLIGKVYIEARPKGRPDHGPIMISSSKTMPTHIGRVQIPTQGYHLGSEGRPQPAGSKGPAYQRQEQARPLAGRLKPSSARDGRLRRRCLTEMEKTLKPRSRPATRSRKPPPS